MMSRGWRLERRGVALPLTLIVLTVLMLLTGTALMLARLESRSAGETLAATQATAAAEAGFEIAAADWPVEAWDTLPPGATVASAAGAWGRQLHVDSITHLGGSVYLQTAVGEVRDAGGGQLARAALGRWMGAEPPRFPDRAAIVARGPLELGGGMSVDGADQVPAPWGGVCPPPGAAAAAVSDSAGPPVFSAGCVGGSCLTGSPALVVDSTVSDSLLSSFGAWDFTTLRAVARQHLAGVVSAPIPVLDSVTGRCDPSVHDQPWRAARPLQSMLPVLSHRQRRAWEPDRTGSGTGSAAGRRRPGAGRRIRFLRGRHRRRSANDPGARHSGHRARPVAAQSKRYGSTYRGRRGGPISLRHHACGGSKRSSSASARGQLESVLIWHFSRAAVGCRSLPSRGKVRKWLIFHGLPLTTRDGILVAF